MGIVTSGVIRPSLVISGERMEMVTLYRYNCINLQLKPMFFCFSAWLADTILVESLYYSCVKIKVGKILHFILPFINHSQETIIYRATEMII